MKIEVRCSCGNKAEFHIPSRKNLVFRDNLEANSFRLDNDKNIKLIQCDLCKDWITLDMN